MDLDGADDDDFSCPGRSASRILDPESMVVDPESRGSAGGKRGRKGSATGQGGGAKRAKKAVDDVVAVLAGLSEGLDLEGQGSTVCGPGLGLEVSGLGLGA